MGKMKQPKKFDAMLTNLIFLVRIHCFKLMSSQSGLSIKKYLKITGICKYNMVCERFLAHGIFTSIKSEQK